MSRRVSARFAFPHRVIKLAAIAVSCVASLVLVVEMQAARLASRDSLDASRHFIQQTPEAEPEPSKPKAPASKTKDAAPGSFRSQVREHYLARSGVEDSKKRPFPKPNTKPGPAPASGKAPMAIKSANGSLNAELIIDYADLKIGNDPVHLRTYNGQLAGPTLRVKAGDTMYITLRNRLRPMPSTGHPATPNTFHDWNTTNLHFHGLHVAPQGTKDAESDNVLLEIPPVPAPGESVQKYAVKIPADHPAGTFWYHAHKHGSTAAQVSSGLCGALIIERTDGTTNLDSVPEVAAAGEEILLLQQTPYLKGTNDPAGLIEPSADGSDTNANAMFGPSSWGNLKRYTLVGGQKIPVITVAPGAVRRLRVIAAQQHQLISLQLQRNTASPGSGPETLKLYEIAVDGLATGRIDVKTNDTLDMYPGTRSDILINPSAETTGEYFLVDQQAPTGTGADGSPEPLSYVAKIVVTGDPQAMNLPTADKLAPQRLPLIDWNSVSGTQYAFYGLENVSNVFQFNIAREKVPVGKTPSQWAKDFGEFDPTKPRLLTLGKTEQWLIGTRNATGIAQWHPFHIHTNPFFVAQVLDPMGADVTVAELGGPVWRDTMAMKQGYTYVLMTRYVDFIGSFVSHCHILAHEDNGMMELITIQDPNNPAPPRPKVSRRGTPTTTPSGGALPADAPSVQFFVKGSYCVHCMAQLTAMAKTLVDEQVAVTVVTGSSEEDLQEFPDLPFALVADPEFKRFKQVGAFEGEAKHATIVRDARGKEFLKRVGDEPFMDGAAVRKAVQEARESGRTSATNGAKAAIAETGGNGN